MGEPTPDGEYVIAADDTFGFRHKHINQHFDTMLKSLGGPAEPIKDALGAEAMFEVARLTFLNLNAIAEALTKISLVLGTKKSGDHT